MLENTSVEYEHPEIVDYGDLRELTAAAGTGAALDAAFPAKTPFKSLTFS
jgi:hypothetical protein